MYDKVIEKVRKLVPNQLIRTLIECDEGYLVSVSRDDKFVADDVAVLNLLVNKNTYQIKPIMFIDIVQLTNKQNPIPIDITEEQMKQIG